MDTTSNVMNHSTGDTQCNFIIVLSQSTEYKMFLNFPATFPRSRHALLFPIITSKFVFFFRPNRGKFTIAICVWV